MKLKMKTINFKRRQYIFFNFEKKNLWEEEYDLEQLQKWGSTSLQKIEKSQTLNITSCPYFNDLLLSAWKITYLSRKKADLLNKLPISSKSQYQQSSWRKNYTLKKRKQNALTLWLFCLHQHKHNSLMHHLKLWLKKVKKLKQMFYSCERKTPLPQAFKHSFVWTFRGKIYLCWQNITKTWLVWHYLAFCWKICIMNQMKTNYNKQQR